MKRKKLEGLEILAGMLPGLDVKNIPAPVETAPPKKKIFDPKPDGQGRTWLNARAAAEWLGVSQGHIYRLIKVGEIVGAKVGGAWQVDRASLDAYRNLQATQQKRKSLARKQVADTMSPRAKKARRDYGLAARQTGLVPKFKKPKGGI